MAERLCLFCKQGISDRDKVGETFHKDDITVHQYCLYFASGLYQRGDERDGIHGFLLADIRKELARASRLTCRFCHRKGAATGCAITSCRQMCHASCGLTNGFLLHHHGRFEAFCQAHKPSQKHSLVAAALDRPRACSVCLIGIDSKQDQLSILVCPVCETGFHRTCLQKQAWMAGSLFFRCSVCANKDQFSEEMLRMGLEIPEKDTGWEEESDEQTECQASNCLCPDGRTFYTRMSKYRMKTCQVCANVLGHMVCVKGDICTACKPAQSRPQPQTTVHSSSMSNVPSTGPGCAEVDTGRDASSIRCDCIICQAKAKALTPSSPTPSPYSLKSPTSLELSTPLNFSPSLELSTPLKFSPSLEPSTALKSSPTLKHIPPSSLHVKLPAPRRLSSSRNTSPLLSNGSPCLQTSPSLPVSISSFPVFATSKQASPPLSFSSSVCSYFKYTDADNSYEEIHNGDMRVRAITAACEVSRDTEVVVSVPQASEESVHEPPAHSKGCNLIEPLGKRTEKLGGDDERDLLKHNIQETQSKTQKLWPLIHDSNRPRFIASKEDFIPRKWEGLHGTSGAEPHSDVFIIRIPLHDLSHTSRERLQKRRNNSFTCEFLRNRGLKLKRPRIILRRISRLSALPTSVSL